MTYAILVNIFAQKILDMQRESIVHFVTLYYLLNVPTKIVVLARDL